MPKQNSGRTATQKKKLCCTCNENKLLKSFYRSYNPLHSDGYMPMCKDCIKTACYDELNDDVDVEKLKQVLRQLDRPFIQKYYQSSIDQYERMYGGKTVPKGNRLEIIGYYFKNIQTLTQIRTLNWEQGLTFESNVSTGTNNEISSSIRKNDVVYQLQDDDFELTNEIISLFGGGYSLQEYRLMSNYYDSMRNDYPNISSGQLKLLLRYIRFAVKEEIATSMNNTIDAEKWSKLANDALKQLNQSDLQGGINSFSEFFQKVERTQDVVRIMPKYKYRPNDALDFVIWCFINYCRRLEGKAECSYEEVYKFYDEKVAEYVKQYGDTYGIFTDDPTVNNRERIKEFITLPPEYYRGEE